MTAGVLRGLKGRFQLFGDAMNLTSRMESTGKSGCIHVSPQCANELIFSGKEHWLCPREDTVAIKGKGELKTFWLNIGQFRNGSAATACPGNVGVSSKSSAFLFSREKTLARLIKWNVQVVQGLLKQIVAQRKAAGKTLIPYSTEIEGAGFDNIPLEEVLDVIQLPEVASTGKACLGDPDSVELDPRVLQELEDFLTVLARSYKTDNAFHDFEHASHVTMSVLKLLKRIAAPAFEPATNLDKSCSSTSNAAIMLSSNDEVSYAIAMDPLTQFACVFSALIHDADHPGVPNATLIAEGSSMATAYQSKSIAEQNSVE